MGESGGIKNMALLFGAKAMLKTEEDTAEGLPEENANGGLLTTYVPRLFSPSYFLPQAILNNCRRRNRPGEAAGVADI